MKTKILENDVFDYDTSIKKKLLFEELLELHNHHLNNSKEYNKIYSKAGKIEKVEDIPFLPVSAFKNFELKSVKNEQIIKTLTSSGTTGQAVSKIFLDNFTANLQTFALSKIFKKLIGNSRLPMIIIDSKETIKNKKKFSARTAGILGLFPFGKQHTFILNEKLDIDYTLLNNFIEKNKNEKIIIFGFTFLIWEFINKIDKKINLQNSILFHSGGWKKLSNLGIDNNRFKNKIKEVLDIDNVINYYGMVEQVGAIFIEDENDNFITPVYSDILIRNPRTLEVSKNNEIGLIQVLSVLPHSYPGHSILTEDLGMIIEDSNKRKTFKLLGRAKKAELRGCSDTIKN